MAFSLFTFLTANRVRDCIRIYCNRFTKLPAYATICSRFKWSIAQTKNDMSGQGPESGRCFVIPCSCIKNSSKVEAKAFARKLLIDPEEQDCVLSKVLKGDSHSHSSVYNFYFGNK